MFEQYFRLPRVLARIRASAFAPELEALVEYLKRRGHRGKAVAGYLRGAEHLAERGMSLPRSPQIEDRPEGIDAGSRL